MTRAAHVSSVNVLPAPAARSVIYEVGQLPDGSWCWWSILRRQRPTNVRHVQSATFGEACLMDKVRRGLSRPEDRVALAKLLERLPA